MIARVLSVIWLAAALNLLAVVPKAAASGLDEIDGPAASFVKSTLANIQRKCSTGKCTIASQVEKATITYGKFENDHNAYAVVLASFGDGSLLVLALASSDNNDFHIVGFDTKQSGRSLHAVTFKPNYHVTYDVTGASNEQTFDIQINNNGLVITEVKDDRPQPQWFLFADNRIGVAGTNLSVSLDTNFDLETIKGLMPGFDVTTEELEGQATITVTFKEGNKAGFTLYGKGDKIENIVAGIAGNTSGIRTGMKIGDVPGARPRSCMLDELMGNYECVVGPYTYHVDVSDCLVNEPSPEKLDKFAGCAVIEQMSIGTGQQ